MEHRAYLIFTILSAVIMSGCSTIFKPIQIDADPPTSVSMDAKQRLVIAKKMQVKRADGSISEETVVCAEPSPDAFRALAAAGGANVALGGKEVGGSGGVAESAGALAVRTQSIQLLRDGLYRACEAYINGAIDANNYRRIIAGYDEVLITLVALEGLGRPVTQPLPVLGTKSKGEQEKKGTIETEEAEETTSGESSTSGSAESVFPSAQAATTSISMEKHSAMAIHSIVRDYFLYATRVKGDLQQRRKRDS